MKGNQSIEEPLTPQSRQLLVHFLAHPHVIVSKEDIATTLWPEEMANPDNPPGDARIQKTVSILREKLRGSDVGAPHYIEVERKMGYRFHPESLSPD